AIILLSLPGKIRRPNHRTTTQADCRLQAHRRHPSRGGALGEVAPNIPAGDVAGEANRSAADTPMIANTARRGVSSVWSTTRSSTRRAPTSSSTGSSVPIPDATRSTTQPGSAFSGPAGVDKALGRPRGHLPVGVQNEDVSAAMMVFWT